MGMREAWLIALLGTVACGGAAVPPQSPPAEPAAANGEATPPADAPEASEKKADSGTDSSASGAPASDADLTAILQLVVNDPELDAYLHLGEPGRFPLQIAGEKLPNGLKLIKSNEPVKVVEGPKSKKDAVLVVTELDVQGDKASVRYRYDVEGIRGNVTLARSAHGWELKNSRLVEH